MLPFPEGVYTSAHRAKHGAFRMGVVSLPSDCFTRFGNPAWPGGRTANFAAFGAWPWVLPKNAESLRDSDALMRVAVPRRRGPAGLRDLFLFLPKLRLLRSAHTGPFRVCEAGWYHHPQRALRVAETLDDRMSKWFICRFLASPISIYESPCRILPISALIQIACRWISRGHIACPWLMQA